MTSLGRGFPGDRTAKRLGSGVRNRFAGQDRVQLGQQFRLHLWILGKHRLRCGDSSNPEDVDRLLDGATIHLANCDPPYGVNVEPRSNNAIAAGLSSFEGTKHHQALDLAQQLKARGDEALALHQLGVVHAHADPSEAAQAAASYHQALALAEELSMRPLQAHCHRGLGMLYAATGQREQARTELSTAIEMYRAMEMTFWLPQAEAALAQVEG